MKKHQEFDKDYANFLAEEAIRQFQEYPLATDERMPIDKDKLAEILIKAEGFQHETRMQFAISGNERNNRIEHHVTHLIGFFYPRRIFTNYTTSFKPTHLEKTEHSVEESLWQARKMKFAPEVICRKMRSNSSIYQIRARALNRGYKYSLMVQFNTLLLNVEESPIFGGQTEVDIPLIFIPGATGEDLDNLAKFCIEHQNPKDEFIVPYTQTGVFKDYLYPNQRKKS